MYMQTASIPRMIIPSSNWHRASAYAQHSPFTAVVSCATGYVVDNGDAPTMWVAVWGDGMRVGSEVCDDGGVVNGDGWSSDWKHIEEKWAWAGGDQNTSDTCIQCPKGYTGNLDRSKWIPEEPSKRVQTMTTSMVTVIETGIGINFINSILGSSSIRISLHMLNAVRMLLLLPLIDSYLPLDTIQFIRSMSFSSFDFEFLSLESNSDIKDDLLFEQKNSFLYLIGLKSGSWIINLISVSVLLLLILMVHVMVIPIYSIISQKQVSNWFSKIVKRMIKELTFGVYVKLFYEVYLLLVLVSISEINQFEVGDKSRTISLVVASALSLFCFVSLLLVVYQLIETWRYQDSEEVVYLVEFFSGIKGNRKARIYSSIFMLKRILLCSVVIFMNSETLFHMKLVIFFCFQLSYLIYIAYTRPFIRIKDNLWEILSESTYTALWGFMLVLNRQQHWKKYHEDVFLGLIISNNFLLTTISLSKSTS